MSKTTDIVEVVKIKPFLFLWLGQVVSQIATNMLTFVLTLRIYQATGSNTQVSILVLAIAIPALLFGMLAGVFVDRAENKLILVFCNVLRMIAVLGFFLSSETLLWVVVLAVIMSTVTQFFVPAEAPTIPIIVPSKLILVANSLFTFTFYGSIITGFVLAGPALRFFGPKNVFLLLSVMYFMAAVCVRFLPGSSARVALKQYLGKLSRRITSDANIDLSEFYRRFSLMKKELFEGYAYIKDNKNVLTAISLMVVAQASIAILGALAPGFADQVLAIDIEDSSMLLLAPAAVGLISGALFVGQFGKKWKRDKIINSGIVLGGTSLMLLSLTHRFKGSNELIIFGFPVVSLLTFAIVMMFFLGVANAFIDVTCNTILQSETTDEFRGRVYGVLTALVGGMSIMPVILAGILSDFIGVGRVLFFISLFILLVWFYRLRNLRYNSS